MFRSLDVAAVVAVAALPEIAIAHVPVALTPETEGAPTSV
jgi:hypothetical protein